MRRWHRIGIAVAAAVGLAEPARAATPAEVQAAIDRGREFLVHAQANGNWELVQTRNPKAKGGPSVENGQFGGLTALATFALLAGGANPQDPAVKSGVSWLRTADVGGVYALGLRAQVWSLIPSEPWVRQAVKNDRDALIKGIGSKPPAAGTYGYLVDNVRNGSDHSVSQFGVLGLWAAVQAGAEVPTAVWRQFDTAWKEQQRPDGAWTYATAKAAVDRRNQARLSMTAAGVATLFITQEYTQMSARCGGNVADPAIDRGMAWLGDHLNDSSQNKFYTLFGISRVGLAGGFKYVGRTDWFDWGADQLIKEQRKTGGWGGTSRESGVIATSFAVLFLSRGRAPVMMNKLSYDVVGTGAGAKATPGTWNQRPRDAANLARQTGKLIESPLNWQVVGLDGPAADLHDAPILYMAGGTDPRLSAADEAKLRLYAEDGGLILGHADCSSPAFANGFRHLGERLFPGRTFRTLPADHVIYAGENFPNRGWPNKTPVEGITNGDRELMVLIPNGDPARVWQTQSFVPIKSDPFGQLMVDLFLYSVDKSGLRNRGDTYLVPREASRRAAPPVTVARLNYAGNWDPEPGGWRRLGNVMHNAAAAELDVRAVDPATLTPATARLASLTVAGPVALTEPQRKAIRDYVAGGGTLLVDALGGTDANRAAAEAELAQLFPAESRTLSVVPGDDPMYRSPRPLGEVHFRRFARARFGKLDRPQLRSMSVGGRAAVFYSALDVSTGMVGEPVDGIIGYEPASATDIVAHVVGYAMGR